MDIKRSGSQPSGKGPAEWFTGTVRIDPLFQATAPARAVGASVTFEPGARTAWHTHPLGQTLIVTAGCGLAQRWGGPVEEIRPGDVVWFPPGEKHWHGAAPTTAMTHIAIQEALDGKVVEGVVSSISPASGAEFSLLPPDNATGNFTKVVQRVAVRITFPEDVLKEVALRPGLSVVATVHTRDPDAPKPTLLGALGLEAFGAKSEKP